MDKKSAHERKFTLTPSMETVDGQPENCNEIVNHYGRCNVQLTSATDNEYPAIAQGLSEKIKAKTKEERDEWLRHNKK